MGRSSISLGSFEYLLSLMLTSPFPLRKASASLTQDISFTHGRHPLAQIPLPSTSEVQGERRVELVRAMLSRSLHSPLHLKCNGKITTFQKATVRHRPTKVRQCRICPTKISRYWGVAVCAWVSTPSAPVRPYKADTSDAASEDSPRHNQPTVALSLLS